MVPRSDKLVRITDKGLVFLNNKGYGGLSLEADKIDFKEHLETKAILSYKVGAILGIVSLVLSFVALFK